MKIEKHSWRRDETIGFLYSRLLDYEDGRCVFLLQPG
jgi:hypothetical protein